MGRLLCNDIINIVSNPKYQDGNFISDDPKPHAGGDGGNPRCGTPPSLNAWI
jgi:hypothetical protein